MENYPVLRSNMLFRENELVYINRSNELEEYCNVMHCHDFLEIAFVISGNGIHRVAEKEYETTRGDIFIINFDVPHGFFQNAESGNPLVVYNCVFLPQFLDLSLFSASHFEEITTSFLFKSIVPENFTPMPDLKLSGIRLFEISELFDRMYAEYRQRNMGYIDIIRAYLIEIIVKIFRYSADSSKREVAKRNSELIRKSVEYMKLNYRSEISLSNLALHSLLSKNYFSRLFKEVTGTNVSDYIQYLRTEQACTLLRTTDMKIVEIAGQTGFSDMKFFYEVFKKITGKTPGEYRKTSGYM
jgi:AraC family transcriptional regulator, L-rhamnose operon transcriptional activator RhaR